MDLIYLNFFLYLKSIYLLMIHIKNTFIVLNYLKLKQQINNKVLN